MTSFLLLAFLALPAAAQGADIGLITAAEARALIEGDPAQRPLVLDTRGGYKDYFRGHLPHAHHINFDTLRGTDGGVPVQYLPDDLTRQLLERAGVVPDRLVVVYAEGAELPNDEVLSSTMVAYVLEKFGVQRIRIVDGGLPAWRAGFPLTQEYPETRPGKLETRVDHSIGVDVETVLAHKDAPNGLLVDARPPSEYAGEDSIWLRKGHIPGAVNFHWARLMQKDNTHAFRPVEEAKKELAAAGITPDKDVIVYCGTSREGSLLRFWLRHVAGYPRVRLYEGSWKEYAALKHLPVETAVPGKKP